MEKEFDVFGIGSPLMDILIQVSEEQFLELNLKKGTMHLIDELQVNDILSTIEKHEIKMVPAGACANTMMGVAQLGGKCCFCGHLGRDDHGDFYEEIMTKDKIKTHLVKTDEHKTGQVYSFITPDSERTMVTHLGAAIHLIKEHIAVEDIAKSKILYLTAYLLEAPSLRAAAVHAIEEAKAHGVKVVVDLADPELIKRCKDDLKKIVEQFVDICLVNEMEAEAFTGKPPAEAVHELAKMCEVAVVKLGKEGSLIKQGDKLITVAPVPAEAIDTTGAGDLFAAGFLYALTQGKDLETCGKVGSFVGSKAVTQIGARLSEDLSEEVNRLM